MPKMGRVELIPSTQDEMPEGQPRCIACPSTAVSIVALAGFPPVWACKDCERVLTLHPAGITTGSQGRVLA
jgi:hypothetical protein